MAYFKVLKNDQCIPSDGPSCAYLLTDNWNDWWEFETLFHLIIIDNEGNKNSIGEVKIGQFNMNDGQKQPNLFEHFDQLDERFFSLGQSDSYYDNLNQLGADARDRILRSLRDMALDPELFTRSLTERVTGTSLLRYVSRETVLGQFRRIAQGGARLTRYAFEYIFPNPKRSQIAELPLTFEVEPESSPPTNIHVLIGRNGVGKTTILNNMAIVIVDDKANQADVGAFRSENDVLLEEPIFTNLVSVTFSAFDPFMPLPNRRDKSTGVQYAYIGLKHTGMSKEGKPLPPKSPETLSRDFSTSVMVCRLGARVDRWRRALELLEADPIFRDAEVAALARDNLDEESIKTEALRLFKGLSSGHKIVLLTITRLVETVEEKTIVLLDEPEAHLHPPLLSAFIRSLSDLLINRNGVAVIATHSPVVLQEVPKRCVWKIRRSGSRTVAERPDIETFGENVGILTREVFGLEVTHSGFHKMLHDVVAREKDYDAIVECFGGELGSEARAIVRGLLASQETDDDDGAFKC
ncbi:MAG: AAA family ATPase [Magnetococcales bacterium]|nr:AAA family ATPase [Magnetococcales bacterium]